MKLTTTKIEDLTQSKVNIMYMCQQWIENRTLSTNTSNVVNVNEHQAEWSRDCIYRTSAHFADVKNHSYESVDPKFRNSPIPLGEESVSNQDTLLFPRSLKLIKINLWQFLQNRFWFVHGDNVMEARIYPIIYTSNDSPNVSNQRFKSFLHQSNFTCNSYERRGYLIE